MNNYYIKYLKYKNKYLNLKKQIGYGPKVVGVVGDDVDGDDIVTGKSHFNPCKLFFNNNSGSCWMISILMIIFSNNETLEKIRNFDEKTNDYNKNIIEKKSGLPYFFFNNEEINESIKELVIKFILALKERIIDKITQINGELPISLETNEDLPNPPDKLVNRDKSHIPNEQYTNLCTHEDILLRLIKQILFNDTSKNETEIKDRKIIIRKSTEQTTGQSTEQYTIHTGGNIYDGLIVYNILNITLLNKIYDFNILYDRKEINFFKKKISLDSIKACDLSTSAHSAVFYICKDEKGKSKYMYCSDNYTIEFNWKMYFEKVIFLYKDPLSYENIEMYITNNIYEPPKICYRDIKQKKYIIYEYSANIFEINENVNLETIKENASTINDICSFYDNDNNNNIINKIFFLKLYYYLSNIKLDSHQILDIFSKDEIYKSEKIFDIKDFYSKNLFQISIEYDLKYIFLDLLNRIPKDKLNENTYNYVNHHKENILFMAIEYSSYINIVKLFDRMKELNINYNFNLKNNNYETLSTVATRVGNERIRNILKNLIIYMNSPYRHKNIKSQTHKNLSTKQPNTQTHKHTNTQTHKHANT